MSTRPSPDEAENAVRPRFRTTLRARLVRERLVRCALVLVAGLICVVAVAGDRVRRRGGLGTEIFPQVDAGQLQVRLRAPTGTRVERTEALALQALDLIKHEVGANNVEITLGFVGVHGANYPINLIHLWNGGSGGRRGAGAVEAGRESPASRN